MLVTARRTVWGTDTEVALRDSAPLISVVGVSKVFGRTRALVDVSLEVAAGESAVLFGANGSGKTTLLKVVSTVMSPTSGSVSVCGHSTVSDAAAVRVHTGVLLHEPSVYSELTVRENLALFGRLCRLDDVDARVRSVASDVRVEHLMDSRVRVLSHGLRKRVGLAISVMHSPRVLVLDEPGTGLDDSSLRTVVELVRSVLDRGGCCLISTHDADFARRVGTRFYRLADGRLTREDVAQAGR